MGRREEGTHQPIEYEPRFARLTTVTRVLGDKPPTDGLFTEEMRMDYDYLAHLEILAAKVPDHKTGDEHFVFVSEPLDGDAILHLLYHAAPSKNEFYRYDRNDLLNDWNSLYQDNDLQRARLERHRRIPGWSHFEKRRAEIREVIDQKTDTYLNPTVVLTRHTDGELAFNYDEDHRITSTVWEQ
ncbi:hypothetical protein HYS00_02320, partial [Candidatus Microgenomates bacterium]|nr:hypothetical protein [Candidatus Microgenomates bacterium]